ncbi:flagellar basal body-associated FliL family protein [Carnobacterium antarcticum]|uniref:Flagellar protein FliL n=1 Tax=Carnobacterium antarcticum TaxID=2126436 RepID=A0ABW4NL36_9LACT|nr:flagellar basal body-associated FliL family protein [Carnobacterium sp. CP1]ALV22033.1 hypothetical protein NY10_1428 [Carnobacterium sp. CP1]
MEVQSTKDKEKKKWLKPLIIIVSALIIGGIVSFSITSGKVQAFVQRLGEEEKIETTVPLEEFLVNLSPGETGKGQYLKIELSVYSLEEDAQELIDKNIPQIRDAVISVLRTKTSDTVFQEEEGSLVLKKELISQINETLGNAVIRDVFITNIIMQ